ncbi:uncharacterized protein TRIADDRAFT_54295 [Trichoplax adhaerens]|uniref:Uncharacterized protein n=1 Tax=Trichoplax adhaerens TaxID=10228 RepID=B3RRM6_TRIAD|nr:hypothetical protein TRIADDRAFT_54295 [Trichoplax adhaerens]EDV26378.1 hypothetical protein TRIADDRAFT_54295 [Trichoplax adhaerens]|eukprot:XP_002110374.1 hypothetical protein TRIADDRAFT_54295 [Trichoplax adhaerens]
MALRGSNDKRSILLRRMEQLKEWENSDTNKESNTIKSSRRSKIKFGLGTMFFAAVSAFDETEVKRLLKQGVDIDYCNNDGLTALHQAKPPMRVDGDGTFGNDINHSTRLHLSVLDRLHEQDSTLC